MAVQRTALIVPPPHWARERSPPRRGTRKAPFWLCCCNFSPGRPRDAHGFGATQSTKSPTPLESPQRNIRAETCREIAENDVPGKQRATVARANDRRNDRRYLDESEGLTSAEV